jgi:hypothetical protein
MAEAAQTRDAANPRAVRSLGARWYGASRA